MAEPGRTPQPHPLTPQRVHRSSPKVPVRHTMITMDKSKTTGLNTFHNGFLIPFTTAQWLRTTHKELPRNSPWASANSTATPHGCVGASRWGILCETQTQERNSEANPWLRGNTGKIHPYLSKSSRRTAQCYTSDTSKTTGFTTGFNTIHNHFLYFVVSGAQPLKIQKTQVVLIRLHNRC